MYGKINIGWQSSLGLNIVTYAPVSTLFGNSLNTVASASNTNQTTTTLKGLVAVHSKPGMIVSDNGTELTSNAVLEYCGKARIEWH